MACAIGLSRILREDRATKDGYMVTLKRLVDADILCELRDEEYFPRPFWQKDRKTPVL